MAVFLDLIMVLNYNNQSEFCRFSSRLFFKCAQFLGRYLLKRKPQDNLPFGKIYGGASASLIACSMSTQFCIAA